MFDQILWRNFIHHFLINEYQYMVYREHSLML